MTDKSNTTAQIAGRLTPEQRKALEYLEAGGCLSLRPYHNLHGDIAGMTPDGNDVDPDWSGRTLDALHRMGLACAYPDDGPVTVANGPHPEVGDVEADHRWEWTPLGAAVLDECRKVIA